MHFLSKNDNPITQPRPWPGCRRVTLYRSGGKTSVFLSRGTTEPEDTPVRGAASVTTFPILFHFFHPLVEFFVGAGYVVCPFYQVGSAFIIVDA